ncbi:MAG TPA: diguanylate cyclase [Steroidobacteraceae bacterium]|nr:diguanylate cyclase [Steroidobacteraceae bacterium]
MVWTIGNARNAALRACCSWLGGLLGSVCLTACAPAACEELRWDLLAAPQFSHYTVDTGLPYSALTAIARDRDGFIWIGSQTGLMRFDGYSFRTYQHDPRKPGSLPSNFVQSLLADGAGHVWVGTGNAGLARYDSASGTFVSYPVGGAHGTSEGDIETVIDDGKGGIWIGTESGLDHLLTATGRIASYRDDLPGSGQARRNRILALHLQPDGALLVGSAAGLARFHTDSRRFEPLLIADPSGRPLEAGVDAFGEDSAQRLWFGTTHHGVGFIDSNGIAHQARLHGGAADVLADQSVRGIARGPADQLIFATYGAGLFTIDTSTLAVEQIRHSDCDRNSLLNDQTYGAMRDPSGLLWVPTEQGLSITDPDQRAFQSVVADCTRSDRLAEGNGLATFVDSRGRLWVGYHTSGADVFGVDGRRLARLTGAQFGGGAGGDHSVYAFAETADGTVWIGTADGLYRVVEHGGRLLPLPVPNARSRLNVQRLLADGPGLWVGSRTGLFRYDSRSAQWRDYSSTTSSRLADDFVLAILRRSDGRVWLGTRKGLSLLDAYSGTAVPFQTTPSSAPLQRAFIVDLSIDRNGRLWVATIDDGLYVLTPSAPGAFAVSHLGELEGLPAANIDALQLDLAGDLWVSTDNGLAVIDPRSMHVRSYRRADGVRFGDYWAHASARTPAGDVIFGAIGGLTVVHPALLRERRFEPQLLVSGIIVAGHSKAAVGPSGGPASPIVVPPEGNAFQVEFAATDYTAPQDLHYAYRLIGYDSEWSVVGAAKRTAAYTNLQPGDYRLLVRATNREGVYAARGLAIAVRVLPAWYQTWLFRLAAALVAAYLIVLLVNARTAYLRRQRAELEALVAERTQELSRSAEELRRSKQQVEEIAYLDAVTGLANRRLFARRFANLQAAAERYRSGFTLLLVDLDHFKAINDTFGHAAGDAVLIAIAQRLCGATRAVDVPARLGGDEFAVLLDATVEQEAIQLVCERILRAFAEPVRFESHVIPVSASIGCAVYARDGADQATLYRAADTALYTAKHCGRNTWRIHAPTALPDEQQASVR